MHTGEQAHPVVHTGYCQAASTSPQPAARVSASAWRCTSCIPTKQEIYRTEEWAVVLAEAGDTCAQPSVIHSASQ